MWNGLCCCQKRAPLLCISIIHGEISQKRRACSAGDQSCRWCHLPALHRFSRCFFCVSLFIRPSVLAEGWWISHIPNEKILLVSRLIRALWEKKKKPQRNMIAPVKWTNYSPLTTFKAHFYWPIQPNKSLLHERNGTPSFLHSFSKPSFYMIPVITPLWHLNFIEQDFKICRQYIKEWGIYLFQMGGTPLQTVTRWLKQTHKLFVCFWIHSFIFFSNI